MVTKDETNFIQPDTVALFVCAIRRWPPIGWHTVDVADQVFHRPSRPLPVPSHRWSRRWSRNRPADIWLRREVSSPDVVAAARLRGERRAKVKATQRSMSGS